MSDDDLAAVATDGWYRDERAFASEAAHRLLNPLTALRLRLEDLGSQPHLLPAAVAAELRQAVADVDRVDAELSRLLLDRAVRARREAARTDVAAAVDGAVRRWTGRPATADRKLVTGAVERGIAVEVPEAVLALILDGLVVETVRACRGDVSLGVEAALGHVRFRLRFPATELLDPDHGWDDGGRGGVADRVRAAGGRLVLAAGRCGVDLLLPRAHPAVV